MEQKLPPLPVAASSENNPAISTGGSIRAEVIDGMITAAGEDWNLPDPVEVSLCQSAAKLGDDPTVVCEMPKSQIISIDSSGIFDVEFDRSIIEVGSRHELICPQAGGCVVAVSGTGTEKPGHFEILAISEPLQWGEYQLPAQPELSFSDLQFDTENNGGSVIIDGEGFQPGSEISLSQCPLAQQPGSGNPGITQGVDAQDCLYEYGITLTADGQGEIHGRMDVYPTFYPLRYPLAIRICGSS